MKARTYLVVDAAQSFEAIARVHDMFPVLCNDHCRRKFVEANRGGGKRGARGNTMAGSVAARAIAFYERHYRIEREAKRERPAPAQRHQRRRSRAVPIWKDFVGWTRAVCTRAG